MKYGLSEKQLEEIVEILRRYEEVEEAILFGSRAIDTYKEASDVDIAIKGEKATSILAGKIKSHFEEDTYLPFFFDIVAYNSITNENLKQHIDTKGASLYRAGWKKCKLGEVITMKSSLWKKNEEVTSLLSYLENKIDLLHRQNAVLESLAVVLSHQCNNRKTTDKYFFKQKNIHKKIYSNNSNIRTIHKLKNFVARSLQKKSKNAP